MISQMTSTEVKKMTDVANLQIHVEHAINCIKSFRILKNTLAISALWTCTPLCNLKPKLNCSKREKERLNV